MHSSGEFVLHEICVCLFTLDSRPSREHYNRDHGVGGAGGARAPAIFLKL